MKKDFEVTCRKCGETFKFTVSMPGDAVPTLSQAQQALWVEGAAPTADGAIVVEGKRGPNAKCPKSIEGIFAHQLKPLRSIG